MGDAAAASLRQQRDVTPGPVQWPAARLLCICHISSRKDRCRPIFINSEQVKFALCLLFLQVFVESLIVGGPRQLMLMESAPCVLQDSSVLRLCCVCRPLQVFVESLVAGGPRQLMLMESEVQRGPYKAGQPASHMGKIIYPQCRKTGVW